MRHSPRIALAGLAMSLALSGFVAPTGAAESADDSLRLIKYADLGKMIRSLKGKVVVVDFWAEF